MEKSMYVNGKWVKTQVFTSLFSPYTKEILAEIPAASKAEVNEAIDYAENAVDEMSKLTSLERAEILYHISDLLREHREEAAQIISLESAKPLKFALAEIDRTIETYQFAGEEAKRLVGEIIPMDAAKTGKNRFGYTIQQPLGVIGAITPFNFPQNLVAHKVGPAIAAGNSVILKPASQTPLSALFLAKLIDQTKLPKGAFQVVTGGGRIVGDTLLQNEKVKMITFTGSPAVGLGIRHKAGMKRVALELGSNAGLIIDGDTNLDTIVPKCVTGAFSNQGQVCISLQRIYVMDAQYDNFVNAFVSKAKELIIGDPLLMETDISAMIHADEQKRAAKWVEEAVNNGAEILLGGKEENGIFPPTILANVDPLSKVSCEEVFAPIVIVNKIQSIEEGIEAINHSQYGLQAGIFTKDIQTAFEASKRLEVGGVIINDIPTYRVDQMPYGGVKLSGTGKEGLKYAIHEMTETKLIVWNNEGGI
ncbi:aldehyde dehydrogenase [Lysinibacillus sp. 2017]|uniref:aldehyde dehydrogenase family protein n=1 Tax=unclassified Lysinibacillus TaxID=2636778 RepID=UPI000D525C74|nr:MULTISPECIES: aldehyde dehydrogenase family protein [unclassified Lysinibacillus]AWE07678.1 aldehyde dehydrogenase [Lysinibacillus sp. 2017]TGN36840.1 aldehyde dehydrogenase family protein [Lysinibacillus sp. S2017]